MKNASFSSISYEIINEELFTKLDTSIIQKHSIRVTWQECNVMYDRTLIKYKLKAARYKKNTKKIIVKRNKKFIENRLKDNQIQRTQHKEFY